jgi:protein-tyrosine-phosphatase/catechol 2,3-dioxygenase-like lactoylglutathione lyase family enzyme/DNA-binding transcriptional ArsR family regulator
VELVAHPLRWRLLRELVASDRAVRELSRLLDEQQSLVSYHLGRLRKGELVRAHRSAADGRDSYYSIDLVRCSVALQSAGAALHPGLALAFAPPAPAAPDPPRQHTRRILFLCTGNSARSQIAEALLNHRGAGALEAASAGSAPKPLHPNAVRVMRERGIDISANRTKHIDDLDARPFDIVITLCDRVREVCPEFDGNPELVHWSVRDPALEGADDAASYPAFERTADELDTRIAFLLHMLDEPSLAPSRSHRPGGHLMPNDEIVNVRYMVDDVDEAVAFYTEKLGFEPSMNAAPAFADVRRGNLRLLLAGPQSSAGRAMPDGTTPGPGGWNRIHFIVDDIEAEVGRLREAGATFRNDILSGPGGQQILIEDPSGNVVELFQPAGT